MLLLFFLNAAQCVNSFNTVNYGLILNYFANIELIFTVNKCAYSEKKEFITNKPILLSV